MRKTTLMRAGLENIWEERNRLQQVQRPRVIEAIADARESPDFRVRAAYSQAIAQQHVIERRIAELKSKLAGVQMIDADAECSDGRVVLGASVTLQMEPEGNRVCYHIVGQEQADIPSGKLSVSAPVARALLGREKGEVVTVETPGGTRKYRVLEVHYGQ